MCARLCALVCVSICGFVEDRCVSRTCVSICGFVEDRCVSRTQRIGLMGELQKTVVSGCRHYCHRGWKNAIPYRFGSIERPSCINVRCIVGARRGETTAVPCGPLGEMTFSSRVGGDGLCGCGRSSRSASFGRTSCTSCRQGSDGRFAF